jgi:hypothetical protein
MSGPEFAQRLKKEVLGGYVRALESIDPEVACHILNAQKEFFLAGKTFFEAEVGHAEKAINKIRRKQQEEAAAAPAGDPAPEPTE